MAKTFYAVKMLGVGLLLAALYAVSGRLGLLLAIPPGYASAIFPPAGIAVAMLLVFGLQLAPFVTIGSFALNLWMAPQGVAAAAGIAVGATVQAILGAVLVRRVIDFPARLDRERDVALFLVMVGPVACVANALIGPGVLLLAGVIKRDAFLTNCMTWWIGDTLGAVVLAPIVLVLAAKPRALWRRRAMAVSVPLTLAFSLVTAFFVYSSRNEQAALDKAFQDRADDLADVVRRELGGYVDALTLFERHFFVAGAVSRADFHDLVAPTVAKEKSIRGLSWAPVMPSTKPGDPFQVPILFNEPPPSGRPSVLGFDLMSEPRRRAAILAATAGADVRVVSVPKLKFDDHPSPAFLLLQPVYERASPATTPVGFLTLAVRAADIVAASSVVNAEHDLVAEFVDDEATKAPAPGLHAMADIPIGRQVLHLSIRPSPTYRSPSMLIGAWSFMVLGLLFTALLGAYLLAVTGRSILTEGLVLNFRQLADSMPQVVWTARGDGAPDYFNQQWVELAGGDRPPGDDSPWLLQVAATDSPRCREAWAKALAESKPFEIEYRVVAHGQLRWHLARVLPVLDLAGVPTKWIGTSTDIHAQKESENSFRFLAETIAQLVWTSGPDGRIDFFNKRWTEYTGLDLTQSLDNANLLHPDDAPKVRDAWTAALASGGSFDLEYRLRRVDGQFRWQMARARPKLDDSGRVVRWFGTCTDIHDKRVQLEELERARRALELAHEAAQVGTWEFDLESGQVTRTEFHDKLYGIDGMLPGWDMARIIGAIHPDDRAHVTEAIKRSETSADNGYAMDYRVVWPDGSLHWLNFMARFVRDEHGKITHHRGTIFDITNLRTTQEERERLTVRAQAAVESSRLKSEFLANMSHEIRTPINGVLGMAGILLDTPLTPEQRDYAGAIQRSGEALLSVINDILDFSKIEAGRLEIEAVDFSLAQVVEDARLTIGFAARRKGLDFDAEMAADLPQVVRGDPSRLRQVLTNLLANAVKFTPKGYVRLRMRAEGAAVRFEVSDSGIGLSAEAIARLFQPFTQADSSTTRRYGGSGLGLSIAKNLVTRMGGDIGVDSVEGGGSTFWFTVPFSLAADAPAPAELPQAIPATPRRARILVVEDVQVNQVIAVKLVEKLGHSAHVVGNGREALNALAEAPYDLVLMDCNMPDMDGFEATTLIRASKSLATPDLPIVAMTANAMRGDRERCLLAGMNDHVAKPISSRALSAALARWLDPSSALTPNAGPRQNLEKLDAAVERLETALSALDWVVLQAVARELTDACAAAGARILGEHAAALVQATAAADETVACAHTAAIRRELGRVHRAEFISPTLSSATG